MSARAYFYDADTGEEIAGYPMIGTSEAGIWRGRRYIGTHLGIGVLDGKKPRTVRAEEFACRVAVKLWYGPRSVNWCLLVSRSKGWLGNEADVVGGTPHAELPLSLRSVLTKCRRASYGRKAA
jgi:hypothetical protein